MTQQFSFESQCKGKRKFSRRKFARTAMRHLYAVGTSPREVSVYRCPHCEYYHIGRMPKSGYPVRLARDTLTE